MDIKADLNNYENITKCNVDIKKIKKSIDIIINSNIDHEFRTTIMKEYHSIKTIKEIVKLISNSKYYIQNFELSADVLDKTLNSFTNEELLLIQNEFKDNKNIVVRNL